MKIMFCIQGIFNSGGKERVLLQRVNYFVEKFNYECIIVVTDGENKKNFFEINNLVKVENLRINYLDNKGTFIKRVIKYRNKQKTHEMRLREIVKKYQPDIIISMGDEDKNILPKLKGNSKIILEHHFEKYYAFKEKRNILYKIKDYYFLKQEERLVNLYDEFLVLTNEDKEQWSNSKIKVIPNPLSFMSTTSAHLENKKVISVGRLEYQKGYDLLIEVWKKVSGKYPEWILEIYGIGKLKKELQEKIIENNLQEKIFLRGEVRNIEKEYLDSSIYVMTSRYEGFGMVLIEAQACGLPIISFDCPCGPKDIISNKEDGFLCKFGDIDDMANKIIYLIENEDIRKQYGKKAKMNSINFSKEKIMDSWKKMIESLKKENIK